MIKLKPIVEHIVLQEEESTMPTWGDVRKVFQAIAQAASDAELKDNLKKLGGSSLKLGVSLLSGGLIDVIQNGIEAVGTISDSTDVAKAMLTIGKSISDKQLKNPKASEFKKMTQKLWDALRIDPQVSIILDDQIEKQFIDAVIIPKLKTAGSDTQEIPNMNYELGKWLNSQGLYQADIFFKGRDRNL